MHTQNNDKTYIALSNYVIAQNHGNWNPTLLKKEGYKYGVALAWMNSLVCLRYKKSSLGLSLFAHKKGVSILFIDLFPSYRPLSRKRKKTSPT